MNHEKGTDLNQQWSAHANNFCLECQKYGLHCMVGEVGEPITVTLPDGSTSDFIFRFSRYTGSSGYSFSFRKRDFGSDDTRRYYVFALVDSEQSRYLIIQHAWFKQTMDVPMASNTYQSTGEYAFNFGKSRADRLGKWEPFLGTPSLFLNVAGWVVVRKADLEQMTMQLKAAEDSLRQMRMQMEHYY